MDYCCTYIAEPSNPYPDAALAPPPVPSPLGAAGSSFGVVTRSASHGALDWLSSRGGGLGTGDLVLAAESRHVEGGLAPLRATPAARAIASEGGKERRRARERGGERERGERERRERERESPCRAPPP